VSYEKLRRLSGLPRGAPLRWSAFCALLLEQSLIALPESFLKSMRLDAGPVRCCASGVTLARQPLPKGRTPIKRLLAEFGEETVLCAAAADKALRDTEALRAVKDVLESGECWSVRELAIAGDDLLEMGFSEGPLLGKTLKALVEHVIEHPEDNVRARLHELAREMRG
jgi:tRNA nucleotidyltransferase (CCA-adding enzyme)